MPRDINCIEDMVKARDEAQSDLGNMISQQQKRHWMEHIFKINYFSYRY